MASKYIQKYPVPQGFPDILHDFAREVLRDQPENIYEFGYLYFKAMEEVSEYIYSRFHAIINRRCFVLTVCNYRASHSSMERRANTFLLPRIDNLLIT